MADHELIKVYGFGVNLGFGWEPNTCLFRSMTLNVIRGPSIMEGIQPLGPLGFLVWFTADVRASQPQLTVSQKRRNTRPYVFTNVSLRSIHYFTRIWKQTDLSPYSTAFRYSCPNRPASADSFCKKAGFYINQDLGLSSLDSVRLSTC